MRCPDYDDYTRIINAFARIQKQTIKTLSKSTGLEQNQLIEYINFLKTINCPLNIDKQTQYSVTQLPTPYNKDLIDSYISKLLPNQFITLHLLVSTTSSNHYLKKFSLEENTQVCLCEHQTQGRGRRGKVWQSPFAGNIYCSIRHRVNLPVQKIGPISLIIGLAVVTTLCNHGITDLKLKWPNDILADGKKLAGILVETMSIELESVELIIGIGINYRVPDSNGVHIKQAWTDLSTRHPELDIDRNMFIADLISKIIKMLRQYEIAGWGEFVQEWQKLDYTYNKKITITNEDSFSVGTARGVTELGELIVRAGNDYIKINSGEVSVKIGKSIQ